MITILTSPSSISATPDMGIDEKDIFSIVKLSGGMKVELPNEIKFTATDGSGNSQTVKIYTSCSRGLDLGDRFGDFAVFGMDRGDGDVGADSDDSDTDSDSDLGTNGEDGLITLGCEIEYQYKITNPNATSVDNVSIFDNKSGFIVENETLASGEMKTFFSTRTLFETTTNQAVVTGDDEVGGGQCEAADDEVTVTVTLPPQGSFSCKKAKPIDGLTMEWGGTIPIRVRAWDGIPGSALLADIDNIQPGDIVTVTGMGGAPKTQVWELFLAGTPTQFGASAFHISCSDSAMNGVEDCGSSQGNDKGNHSVYNNEWLLQGIVGDEESLDCTPAAIAEGQASGGGCGLGAELVFLLPGLMWLARRRRG